TVYSSRLPQPFAHLTSAYLTEALTVARERLIAPHQVAQAQARVDGFREYVGKLQHASADPFFTGEYDRSQMLLQVAEGSLAEMQHELKTRQLDYLYVQALKEAAMGDAGEGEVMSAMEDVFRHRSDLSVLQTAATARINYRRWKAQQTAKLKSLGVASWLETARSQRDLRSAEAQLQKLAEEARIHQLELQRFQMIRQQGEVITADKRPKSMASVTE
ncbi:hypothetical protein OAH18_02635, partial [bacterium]|nr:hypothetical protein [bacterium]